jgi:hypothetical protein
MRNIIDEHFLVLHAELKFVNWKNILLRGGTRIKRVRLRLSADTKGCLTYLEKNYSNLETLDIVSILKRSDEGHKILPPNPKNLKKFRFEQQRNCNCSWKILRSFSATLTSIKLVQITFQDSDIALWRSSKDIWPKTLRKLHIKFSSTSPPEIEPSMIPSELIYLALKNCNTVHFPPMPNLQGLSICPFRGRLPDNIPTTIVYLKTSSIENFNSDLPNLKYVFMTTRQKHLNLVDFLSHIPEAILLYINEFSAAQSWYAEYEFGTEWAARVPPKVRYLGMCLNISQSLQLPKTLQYFYPGLTPYEWKKRFGENLPNLVMCGDSANRVILNFLKKWKKTVLNSN